jgi:hypothetical protein
MNSKLFWKCDCGIEWQAVPSADHKLTVYACICGRRRTFNEKALTLYYAPQGNGLRPVDWKEVTAENFEIRN